MTGASAGSESVDAGSTAEMTLAPCPGIGAADGSDVPVFTILRAALSDAVRQGRLAVNPTDRATPPSPSEARPPEMPAWTAAELARFLRWADADDPGLAMGWRLLAATGMRRGEALALRWRDVDLAAARLQVRRSVGTVKDKGAGQRLVEGPITTGQSRVIDLDAGTVAALQSYRAAREQLSIDLVRDSALVLSGIEGEHRHPDRFSRSLGAQLMRARRRWGRRRCRSSACTTSGTPTPRCCSLTACR